jgi:hypothetical protein
MKVKVLLTAIILIICIGANAQSMFKTIPKPQMRYSALAPVLIDSLGNVIPSTPAAQTTTGFRFTGPMVLYSLPGSAIYTGIGIDYEHDTYNTSTSKWSTDWAVAIGGYEGGQFAPNNIQAVTAVGFSVQLFNKLLTVGVLYDLTNKRVQGGVGPSVSLNN